MQTAAFDHDQQFGLAAEFPGPERQGIRFRRKDNDPAKVVRDLRDLANWIEQHSDPVTK